jgi:hypothetical protein
MLPSQLSQLKKRKESPKEEEGPVAMVQNQSQPKRESFSQIQSRHGSLQSPTDLLLVAGKTPTGDIDYQKTARQAVVGELAGLSGVQASKIGGVKRGPSQSPSMRLLGMLHVHDDPDEPITESRATSKEYTGDQGRYLPPRRGQGVQSPSYGNYPVYRRCISSQL